MSRLYWMHTDCMSQSQEALRHGTVFIFDDEQIEAAGWGLKRVQFLYECLLEMRVEIYRGRTIEILSTLAKQRQAMIVTTSTPDPWLQEIIRQLAIEQIPAPRFVDLTEPLDLKRFSRYWKRAEPTLLS